VTDADAGVCTADRVLARRRTGAAASSIPRRSRSSRCRRGPPADGHLARPLGAAADVQQTLLERAGGNPLYAEQFAQLYLEKVPPRKPLPRRCRASSPASTACPPTRRRTSTRSGRGKVFWTGARQRSVDSETVVHPVRKGLRRQRRRRWPESSSWIRARSCVTSYGHSCREPSACKHRRWPSGSCPAATMTTRRCSRTTGAPPSSSPARQERNRWRANWPAWSTRVTGHSGSTHSACRGYYTEALSLWPARYLGGLMSSSEGAERRRRRRAGVGPRRPATPCSIGDRETAGQRRRFLSRAWYRGHGWRAARHRASRAVADAGTTVAKAACSVLARPACSRRRGGGDPQRYEALALAEASISTKLRSTR
jgi:hypothetical protein